MKGEIIPQEMSDAIQYMEVRVNHNIYTVDQNTSPRYWRIYGPNGQELAYDMEEVWDIILSREQTRTPC